MRAVLAAAVLALVPAAAGARVLEAETVLPTGQSGHVPARAAGALSARFGSADPSAWRDARRMYDVEVTGLAPKPALRFYDRGTWQQSVALGP